MARWRTSFDGDTVRCCGRWHNKIVVWWHGRGMFVAGGTISQWCHNCVPGAMATQLRIHGFGTSQRHGMTVVSHWWQVCIYASGSWMYNCMVAWSLKWVLYKIYLMRNAKYLGGRSYSGIEWDLYMVCHVPGCTEVWWHGVSCWWSYGSCMTNFKCIITRLQQGTIVKTFSDVVAMRHYHLICTVLIEMLHKPYSYVCLMN